MTPSALPRSYPLLCICRFHLSVIVYVCKAAVVFIVMYILCFEFPLSRPSGLVLFNHLERKEKQ
jgi:hypothetical protein